MENKKTKEICEEKHIGVGLCFSLIYLLKQLTHRAHPNLITCDVRSNADVASFEVVTSQSAWETLP